MKESWRLFLVISLAALYIIAQPAPPPPFPYPQPIGDMPPSANLPGDCAIVATEACGRVAKAASWARLLHLDLKGQENGHMVCAWQLRSNDPILVYDKFLLDGSTMELQTSQRDAKVIADKIRDVLSRENWKHGKVTITAAHFVQ